MQKYQLPIKNFVNIWDSLMLGGAGKIVEIDAYYLFKRRYHNGKLLQGENWIFGAYFPRLQYRALYRIRKK